MADVLIKDKNMNCVNCGGRITNDGCTCTSADLLKKLERSNDDWISEREENLELKQRLNLIYDVWNRWKDFHRTSYPTIEQTTLALSDFGTTIAKSMVGYNPGIIDKRSET